MFHKVQVSAVMVSAIIMLSGCSSPQPIDHTGNGNGAQIQNSSAQSFACSNVADSNGNASEFCQAQSLASNTTERFDFVVSCELYNSALHAEFSAVDDASTQGLVWTPNATKITLQLDSETPTSPTINVGSDKREVFLTQAEIPGLLKSMPKHKTLTFKGVDAFKTKQDVTFSLTGANDMLAKLDQVGCKF